MRKSSATLLFGRFGANPPSSPTPVASPFSFSSSLSVWKTSEATRSADDKFSAPAGTSMNSWKSSPRSEEHTSELQSRENLVCRLLLEKKKKENQFQHERRPRIDTGPSAAYAYIEI